MQSYSGHQYGLLNSTPASSTEQILSFDSLHHQNQDESLLNSNLLSTLSFASSINPKSNLTGPEYLSDNVSILNQGLLTQEYEAINSLDISASDCTTSYFAKNIEMQKLNSSKNKEIRNHKFQDAKLTQKSLMHTSNLSHDSFEPNSQQYKKPNIHLLNPIFLLARLRTPQYASQISKKIHTFDNEELHPMTSRMLAHDSNRLEQLGRNFLFPNSESYEKSVSSVCSPDSSFTDRSPETSCSDASSVPTFSESIDKKIDLALEFVCRENDTLTDLVQIKSEYTQDIPKVLESLSSINNDSNCKYIEIKPKKNRSDAGPRSCNIGEGKLKIGENSIQTQQKALDTTKESDLMGALKLISGPNYNNQTQFIIMPQQTDENTQDDNKFHTNTTTSDKKLYFDRLPILIPPRYQLTSNILNFGFPVTIKFDNVYFNESVFQEINNHDSPSLIKFQSQCELVSQFESQPNQILNNSVSENCIQSNLIKKSNPLVSLLNCGVLVSETSDYEHSDPENLQKTIELTEDSLAAYQYALEAAAYNKELDNRFYLNNNFFDGSFLLEQEISQPSLSNDSYEASSQGLTSLMDEFENDFDLEDDLQDYAIIEAANAEALANDFDGFYGQEFGFYSASELRGRDVYENGGCFRSVGLGRIRSSRNSRFGSHEPILTPITECSEFSYLNSFKSSGIQSPSSVKEPTSPGPELLS